MNLGRQEFAVAIRNCVKELKFFSVFVILSGDYSYGRSEPQVKAAAKRF